VANADQGSSGRDARGRFGPGNPGGPGGSRRRAELRRAVENAVTPDHIAAMIRRAMRKGLEGDLQATKLVLEQATGRPPQAAIEPEALNIRLPEMITPDACGQATDTVILGMTKGMIDREVGKTLLNAIKTRLQALQVAQKERDLTADSMVPSRPIPTSVLRARFRRFKKTGHLPGDIDEAAAVVEKVKAGFDLIDAKADASEATTWFASFTPKARPRAMAMDALLDEAVHADEPVRAIARGLLIALATAGFDLTADLLPRIEVPEFGSVATHVLGLPERIARGRYKAQAKRLLERIYASRKRQPNTLELTLAWRRRVMDAMACFQYAGEIPDDAEILEDVLIMAEFGTLAAHHCGDKVGDLMKLFDTAAQKTGEEREQAIAELQDMAKAGRFM
jgi:hypothetical protein